MNAALPAVPACFGAATVFSHDSDVCRQCMAFDGCSDAAIDTLNKIKKIINVDDLLERHNKAKKAARQIINKADQEREASRPPGNVDREMPKGPVERKTTIAKVSFDIGSDEESVIVNLSLKSKKIAIALCKTGYMQQIKKGVSEGRVALSENGPAFIRVALLLLVAGGFTRKELAQAYVDRLGWTKDSAQSHVSMLYPVLVGFGIAKEEGGRFVPASINVENEAKGHEFKSRNVG